MQMATMETRGVWIEMLCCMWDAPERGKLSGDISELSRILGCDDHVLNRALNEIKRLKIADVTVCNACVTVVSRRMLRDENEREKTRLRVQKHRENSRLRVKKHRDKNGEKACNANVTVPSSSSSSKHIYCQNSAEFRLASFLLEKIIERKPNFKKPDPQKWAAQIDKMIRIDKRDEQTIAKVIAWCQQDEFWQSNILSTNKLRQQFDQLEMKMKNQQNKGVCSGAQSKRAW